VLESRGIWATVQNENLAPYGVGAEVWVESGETESAQQVVREFLRDESGHLSLAEEDARGRLGTPPDESPWVCAACGAPLDDEPSCRHCGFGRSA